MSTTKKINFSKLKAGEVLSEQQFYTVKKVVGNKVQLENDNKENIVVTSDYAESCLTSAIQYKDEKPVSKTEAAQIFLSHSGTAITVNFNKQVKEADVVSEIMTTYQGSTPKDFEKALKKSIKGALEGTERTMVGRHYGELNELGRVQFIDMEEAKASGKDYDSRLRQVDPRSINWFVSRGTKYIVK